jgi:hypothetical protein
MSHRHEPGFLSVPEFDMASHLMHSEPAFTLKPLDDLLAIHE